MEVFLLCPWPLLEVGVEIAVPMFPALLGAAVDFVGGSVKEIKFLGNKSPIFLSVFPWIRTSLLDNFLKQVGFSLTPPIWGEVVLLQTEPLKHARIGCDARNEGCNEFPIFGTLSIKSNILNPFKHYEWAYNPNICWQSTRGFWGPLHSSSSLSSCF